MPTQGDRPRGPLAGRKFEKMKKIIGLAALAFLFSVSLEAQYLLKGTVSDEKGNFLPGATVQVLDNQSVTISDQNGRFSISVPDNINSVLEIRFVGYTPRQVSINPDDHREINVKLSPSLMVSPMAVVKGTRANANDPVVFSQVTREELQQTNMTQDIPFLLSMTPSLVATSDGGIGIGYTGLRIRGTDPSRINVTINGIPYNDSESHDVYWVDIPDFVSSVDNIQVQRGIGTSTNGAAAFGANINIETKTFERKPYAQVNSSYGSFNTLKNTISAGTRLMGDAVTVDFRISDLSTDGYIDRAFAKMRSYYVSAGWFTDRSVLKFTTFQGTELTYQAWGGVPADLLETNRTYNPYTYENEVDDYQQNHYQLHWTYEINPLLNFNAALHYTKGAGFYEQFKEDQDFSDYLLYPVYGAGDTIFSTDLVRQKWLDNRFYGAVYNLSYSRDRLALQFGGGLNEYDGDHYGKVVWAQFASNSNPAMNYYLSNGLKKEASSFIKLNYSLIQNLNFYADLQYRHVNYTIDGRDDDQRDISQSHRYNFFNPKTGLVYTVSNHHRIYGSVSLGNREPKKSNFTDAKPNDKVLPEKMTDFELGYYYENQKIKAGINLYYMDYTDQLVLTGEINDVGSPIMVNVPDSYRRGIEMEANLNLTKSMNWMMNTSLSTNKILDFTESVDNWDTWGQETNFLGKTDLAFSPSVIIGSRFDWKPLNGLICSLSTKFVGRQFIDNTSNLAKSLDPYFLNDLMISYSPILNLKADLRLFLQVNNILNHEYESNAWVYSYYLSGERNHMIGYYPQAGRNFLTGILIGF